MSEVLRCEVTGNPCGTDTWMMGRPCVCKACSSMLIDMPPTPAEEALADQESKTQREHAENLYDAIKTRDLTPDQTIEQLCVLQALAFQRGINLTLVTYGLKEPN